MFKKLLLTFSFIALITVAFSGTTYAAEEEKKITVSEELANTLNILNNLYKEGVITEDEYSSARTMLLDPVSSSGKKTKKNLTAAERKQLKDIEASKLKAQKELLREEKRAERERIKQASLEEKKQKCIDEYKSSEATLECTLKKLNALGSEVLKKNKKPYTTAVERKRLKEAEKNK